MEDILAITFKELKGYASYSVLKDGYENYSIDFLADNYIKAKENKDELFKNIYGSALLLRYWHKINKLYEENKNLHLPREEYFNWLLEAIEYACKYKAWQKKDSKVNANQAINQCISTIRSQHYYQYNLDKHRANMNIASLNTKLSMDEDVEYLDTIEDINENPEIMQQKLAVDQLIQNCINNNKVVESIIIDCMRTNDCSKIVKKAVIVKDELGRDKKVIQSHSEFWPHKVVKLLNDLPKDYKKQFESKYEIDTKVLKLALQTLTKANNSKKYKYLDRTLETCRAFLKRD